MKSSRKTVAPTKALPALPAGMLSFIDLMAEIAAAAALPDPKAQVAISTLDSRPLSKPTSRAP